MSEKAYIQLALVVAGATAIELERGVSAAKAIIVSAGTTPYDAAIASFQRGGYSQYFCEVDTISEESFTDEEDRLSMVWDEAEEAAIKACCAGWPEKPTSARLELVGIMHEQSRPRAAQSDAVFIWAEGVEPA